MHILHSMGVDGIEWGDGAGTAFALCSYPGDSSIHDCRLYASFATIEKQVSSFTPFPGKIRYHRLIAGASRLCLGEQQVELNETHPYCSFSGDLEVRCELLKQPAIAFNLILEEDGARVIVDEEAISIQGSFIYQPELAGEARKMEAILDILLCTAGRLQAEVAEQQQEYTLEYLHALVLTRWPKADSRDVTCPAIKLSGAGSVLSTSVLLP